MSLPLSAMTKEFWWLEYAVECFETGSQVISPEPSKDSDYDYMMLVDPEVVQQLHKDLLEDGYEDSTEQYKRHQALVLKAYPDYKEIVERQRSRYLFQCYRKDKINLIVTCCREYYSNFFKATSLAISLGLKDKSDRIDLFHSICTDTWPRHSIKLKGDEHGICKFW